MMPLLPAGQSHVVAARQRGRRSRSLGTGQSGAGSMSTRNNSRAVATAGERHTLRRLWVSTFTLFFAVAMARPLPAWGATTINGRVTGAGAPISGSTVTLWSASTGTPKQLAQGQTGNDGSFSLSAADTGNDTSLYLVAKGGTVGNKAAGSNAAIALITVVGSNPPATVTINEMTTIASVWTHNQFIDGTAIRGHLLGLKIAAGNVPNFVDLQTGGLGGTIQDPLNSSQTPTMANFATLADLLAACVAQVSADACSKLF